MADRIRIGSLGCGRIVQRGLIPGVKESREAELYALASQREGIAAALAAEHGIAKTYARYEDLLADADVDAVYIPCRGNEHHCWTIAAARAGKHVLCEKPLAMTAAEAEEMVTVCREENVILQEGFMWRLHPRARMTKDLVGRGDIGDLRLIVVSFSFDLNRGDWRLRPELGGGAMWDLGCYGVNAARFFTGEEPIGVDAAARWWETGVDMTMRIGLTFPGGVLANIDCSFEGPFRCRAELVGTAGRIILEHAFQSLPGSSIELQTEMQRGAPIQLIAVPPLNHHACQVDHFCNSIRAGNLLAPAEDGLANTRVLERILTSVRK